MRAQLRLLNDARWRDELPPPPLGKLDSSFKKNTAFAKKLRTAVNQEGLAAVLRDIRGLSLEKYLSEVVASVTEGVLKCTKLEDVWAAVEIVSALHQRFGAAFTSPLLANVLQLMATAAAPPLSAARQAVMMRVMMELCLVGVFRTVSDCARDALPAYVVRNYAKVELKRVVVVVLRDVLLEDIANGGALPVAVAFLRRFGGVLYPETEGNTVSEGTKETDGAFTDTASEPDLAWLEDVRHVLRAYAQATLKALTQTHAALAALNGRVKKTSVRTGRIPEELTAERDAANAVFAAMRDALQSFVEVIGDGLAMPRLADPVGGVAEDDAQVEVVRREDDLGVWDSVETRNFYTRVPVAGVVASEGASATTEDTVDSEVKGKSEGDGSDATAGAAASGERMRDFVSRLDAVSTTAELDSLAADFNALNLTNKASKNRLFKFFLETGEISKLKFFARFLAIHRVALADMIEDLIEYVDRGFRTQIYRSASRLNFKNVLFFCELIRFKLVPLHVVFHKIRALTLSVAASNNLDLLLVVYEQCGRFLLHEPQYRDDMREMVALLKLKRANEQFLINDKMGINGLLVIVEPPVGPSVGDAVGPSVGDAMGDAGHRDPEALFCQHLLRVELKPSNVSLVVRLLRKVDLNASAVRRVLVQCLTSPEQINFESIPQLAVVLANVSGSPATQWLRVEVIDTVLEKVIRGLELTDYRLARLRVADIKYVAALYNFGLVEWRLVWLLLYKVLTTGHPNMQPLPLSFVETDLPDNYLRIQLCCVLLTHLTRTPGLPLGGNWKQHELKRMKRQARAELGQFMCFFEYYIFTKQQPIPRETEFRVSDLFKKLFGGHYERATDLGSAVKKLQAVVAARGDDDAAEGDADAETSEADDDDDDWGESADIVYEEEEEEVDEGEDEEDEGASEDEREDDNADEELTDDLDMSDSSSSASDSAAALREEQLLALDRDIQKMVLDLYAHTLLARKLAVAVPSKRVMELAAAAPAKTHHSAFTFLTKKGKKTSATQVLLPDDLRLSASKRRGDNDEREHRERIMQLVRNME